VASYISADECPLSYNPTLMALLWEALATRNVALLRRSMQKRFTIAPDCAWVNYVRSHDDIGWSFADEDAAEVGINGFDHRQFLNAFYTGRFSGSFAAGLPFNFNPQTQDMRISGTAASLAGLEQALKLSNEVYIEHALARLLLIHSVILSAGGIPLLYLGDEIATLNDYSYEHDQARFSDSRWAHRPRFDWARAALRHEANTIPGTLFLALEHLITLRKQTPALAGGQAAFFDTGNPHVLGCVRSGALLMLANFSEEAQAVEVAALLHTPVRLAGAVDLVKGVPLMPGPTVTLGPYGFMWIA
jgi:glycosidase